MPAPADSKATKDPALQNADLLPCKPGLLKLVPFLDFTIIQCTTAYVFLDYNMEANDNIPQILKINTSVRLFA